MRRAIKSCNPRLTGALNRFGRAEANNHNGMFDRKGRVWFAASVRDANNPDFCKKGSDHPSAKSRFRLSRTSRQLDDASIPKLVNTRFIDTCFGTHHLQFGYDANETLWTSGGGQVIGWVNTKMFDETGDHRQVPGLDAMILDTNGNGKRDEYVEPRPAGRSDQGQENISRLLRRDAEPG